ncbi:MAG: alpha/beta hydrolase [Sphingomonas bacterium]
MPIDPDIQAMLEQFSAAGLPKPGETPAAEMRAAFAGVVKMMPPGPEMARVEDYKVPTPDGDVPVRIYVPKAPPRALMLHIHGGGWTLGDIESSDASSRTYAERLRCAVLSVEYRLAPEHPFPAAVDDCLAALNWTAANAARLLGQELPLIVGGDSAGGNLSAVMCLLARDAQGPEIAAQLLINPATDADIEAPAFSAFESPFVTHDEMRWFYEQYVPKGEARHDPRMAPIRAASLAGLPPAFVLTCEYDLLRAEGEAYGSLLAQAGVATMIKRYPGATHSFLVQSPALARSQEAFADLDAFISGFVAR